MSRPRFIPTEEQRHLVKAMSAVGIKQEDLAKLHRISPKTLRRHFGEEIERGRIEANARVGKSLYEMANSRKHPSATIFWLKTQAGWREVQAVEARPAEIPDFVVVLNKKKAA